MDEESKGIPVESKPKYVHIGTGVRVGSESEGRGEGRVRVCDEEGDTSPYGGRGRRSGVSWRSSSNRWTRCTATSCYTGRGCVVHSLEEGKE